MSRDPASIDPAAGGRQAIPRDQAPRSKSGRLLDRLQLLVALGYDGLRFHGVPPQPGLPTVARALKTRLEVAAGTHPRALCVAARTDKGVHARGNLATCWFPPGTDPAPLLDELARDRDDGLEDVRARVVDPRVHARGISAAKLYSYTVESGWKGPEIDAVFAGVPRPGRSLPPDQPATPPDLARCWQVVLPIDPQRVRRAARHLVGRHDFRSFTVQRRLTASPIRQVHRVDIVPAPPSGPGRQRWRILVEGDGFLRKMVRVMVGTLLECGMGLRESGEIPAILAARNRDAAGTTTPGRGLCLEFIRTDPPELTQSVR